jgi:hypothetical protein
MVWENFILKIKPISSPVILPEKLDENADTC